MLIFVLNSMLLGVGLAMDAFSASMANGLADPGMSRRRRCLIAGTFGGFQFAMPVAGWLCVHTAAARFQAFQTFIPWIALFLLLFIGGEMLRDGIRGEDSESGSGGRLGAGELLVQGIATSIDALSVGFTIAEYDARMAVTASLIIAVVTFFICLLGLLLGRRFGMRLAGRAQILGGVILIAIGIEIFVKGVFF